MQDDENAYVRAAYARAFRTTTKKTMREEH